MLAGNAITFLDASGLPGAGATRLAFAVVVMLALLGWSRAARLSRAEIGLRRDRAARGAALGILLALVAAGLGLLVLRYPPLVGGPVTYGPARAVPPDELALHLLLFLPLGVVLPEELAFRGVLLAALVQRVAAPSAVVGSALAFALWHAAIVTPTIGATNLAADPLFSAIALGGAAAVLFAGGVLLALLRLRTGTLAAPLAAHWAFNAAMLLGLRAFAG